MEIDCVHYKITKIYVETLDSLLFPHLSATVDDTDTAMFVMPKADWEWASPVLLVSRTSPSNKLLLHIQQQVLKGESFAQMHRTS
jgi:hypothetical protein